MCVTFSPFTLCLLSDCLLTSFIFFGVPDLVSQSLSVVLSSLSLTMRGVQKDSLSLLPAGDHHQDFTTIRLLKLILLSSLVAFSLMLMPVHAQPQQYSRERRFGFPSWGESMDCYLGLYNSETDESSDTYCDGRAQGPWLLASRQNQFFYTDGTRCIIAMGASAYQCRYVSNFVY